MKHMMTSGSRHAHSGGVTAPSTRQVVFDIRGVLETVWMPAKKWPLEQEKLADQPDLYPYQHFLSSSRSAIGNHLTKRNTQ